MMAYLRFEFMCINSIRPRARLVDSSWKHQKNLAISSQRRQTRLPCSTNSRTLLTQRWKKFLFWRRFYSARQHARLYPSVYLSAVIPLDLLQAPLTHRCSRRMCPQRSWATWNFSDCLVWLNIGFCLERRSHYST